MELHWTLHPFGEAALLAEAHGDQAVANRTALAAAAALETDPPPGMLAVVPAIASLLVIVAPDVADIAALEQRIRTLLDAGPPADDAAAQIVPITVHFDPDSAPDLPSAAATLGLHPDDLITRLCAEPYRVMMIGFAPGYPYIGPLPHELHLPRRATPRAAVPPGSVAIAAGLAGIYPARLPGGWHLIGRTDLRLFDPYSHPPALLQPGDLVYFRPYNNG